MQIQFPNSPLTVAATRLSQLAAWTLNQLLTADVIGLDADNSTVLRIDGRVVTARSELALVSGQRLTVQVSQLEPTVMLKVVPPTAELPTAVLARGLARTLPQQATPQQTMRLVDELHVLSETGKQGVTMGASSSTVQLAAPAIHILRALPAPALLIDARTLRTVIEQAAMPTEARLHAALGRSDGDIATAMTGDLRSTLQSARTVFAQAQLPGAPTAGTDYPTARSPDTPRHTAGSAGTVEPQADPSNPSTPRALADGALLELIDHVVARLQAHHLQNAATALAPTTQFVVELPLQRDGRGELLRFEYEGGPSRREDSELPARAQIVISLLLDDGHEFTARVRLHDNVLGIRLGSDDADFNHQLTVRQDELRHGLQAQGLEVGELVVGLLEVDKRPRLPAGPLIDARI